MMMAVSQLFEANDGIHIPKMAPTACLPLASTAPAPLLLAPCSYFIQFSASIAS